MAKTLTPLAMCALLLVAVVGGAGTPQAATGSYDVAVSITHAAGTGYVCNTTVTNLRTNTVVARPVVHFDAAGSPATITSGTAEGGQIAVTASVADGAAAYDVRVTLPDGVTTLAHHGKVALQ